MEKAAELSGEIAAALARGVTVVTGNQRAARTLRRTAAHQSHPLSFPQPAPADILSWDAWLAGMWHKLLLDGETDRTLLNRTQEHALWREIIAGDPEVATLRSLDSLALMAADAWATLAHHRGLARLPGSAINSDTEAFSAWAVRFEERCSAGRYLPHARLEGALCHAALAGAIPLPPSRELLLLGFDRILPAQQKLLDALATRGISITVARPPQPSGASSLYPAPDSTTELQAAAAWARTLLEADPASSIAIIVPGLADRRPEIDRTFRGILAPEANSIAFPAEALPYEFSATEPLAQTPIAATALDLLAWISAPLPIERVSHLLLSPCFAGGAEASARAELDAFDLRTAHLLRPEVSIETLLARAARSPRRPRLQTLLATLQAMQSAARKQFAETRTPGDWAERIREFLAASGWAAGSLDSNEFQTHRKWESALDELATLDFEGTRVPFDTARESLCSIAEQTVFAPESRNAPIQIFRPEESAGLRFDALWFLGAGDLQWPTPPAGNPFLPWPLRRELSIPGANPALDAAYAASLTARIAASAPAAVFSYATETADGSQRVSPALAAFPLKPHVYTPATPPAPVRLEAVADALPLPPLPDRPVSGGATVLKDQAACAFRAFATHRLFATELESRDPGLNARERGSILHRALEYFWGSVKTQAELRNMSPLDRRTALTTAIDNALARTEAVTTWDTAYLDAQRKRLLTLGLRWLDLEAARSHPFTVTAREAEAHDFAIGPLRLSLRLDRIDQTEHGLVLIDYKTGEADPAAWLGDRPEEPQLPLYAVLAAGEPLHAVAFGRVRAGKDMALVGYESTPGTLKKQVKDQPDLPTQVEDWHDVLTTLAADFAMGDAIVSPKKYPITCQFCAQRPLCRLDVSTHLRDDQDEEELLILQEARG